MDGLLLLAAEILVIGISAWVVINDAKSPAEISRILDLPPKPPRKQRRWMPPPPTEAGPRPGRPRKLS